MIDIKEIEKILPHRYPFLLIDRIIEVEPPKRAVGIKNVTYNEPFFQGHFPDEPVMPGVLILEAIAQVGAFSVLYHNDYKNKKAYFLGIDKVRFRKKVVPGDTLRLVVELDYFKNGKGHGKGYAYVEDNLVCEAEILFVVK